MCEVCSGAIDGSGLIVDNDIDNDGICNDDEIVGCTDSTACNYYILATDDNGFCNYVDGVCEVCSGAIDGSGLIIDNDIDNDGVCNNNEIEGCTDSTACNYDSNITTDTNNNLCFYVDGVCEACSGAIDGSGLIIDNDIDNDGVCNNNEIEGCTDSTACNYDSNITTDTNNNLCFYVDGVCEACSGAIDGSGLIIDNDIDNDGVCNDDEVEGCADLLALNYNISATDDDGSCIYCASLDLIDNSNYLKVNDISFNNASGVTISFWVYDDNWALQDNTSENFGTFIDFGSIDNFRYVIRWRDGVKGIQAYFEGDGFQDYQGEDCDGMNSDNCYTQNTTSATYIIPPYDFINNNNIYNWWEDTACAWKNITAVFCSNSTRLYIDGQIVQQSMTNVYYPESIFSLDSLDNNIIGSNQLDGQFSEGQLPCDAQIDEVRIWSRALSSLEIQARVGDNVDINLDVFAEQSNDVGKLEGYWKFDSLSLRNQVTNIPAISNNEMTSSHYNNQYCNYQCDNTTYDVICLDSSNSDCDACTPSEGCTDSEADNYDITADIDDGICIYYGCMDNGDHLWSHIPGLEACNYNPNANVNQYSMLEFQNPCVYPIDVFGTGSLDCEGNCLYDCDGDGACDWEKINHCFDVDGNIVTNLSDEMNNITGDMIPDGVWDCLSQNSINIIDNCMINTIVDLVNNLNLDSIPDGIPDCLNYIDYSIYYNPLQTDVDSDGIGNSCDDFDSGGGDGGQPGCTDSTACNYDFWADIDNGLCDYCYLNDCENYPTSYIDVSGVEFNGPYDCFGYCMDLDQDGINDDLDLDNFCDLLDNCPLIWNPGQIDSDNNGVGDACEVINIAEEIFVFSLFPNPFETYAILNFYNPQQDNIIIKLFENTGRLVFETLINTSQYIIYREGLSDGIYMIQLENNDNVMRKLIILE